jgi:flagellar motor switch protein FliM
MDEKFLSQDEIDTLLQGVTGELDDPVEVIDSSAARVYNMATQERIVRGRMPSLELINERFARLLRTSLYGFLRRTADVSVGPIRTSKYSEFLRHLVVPTNLNLVRIKPLLGTALVVMDPYLVFLFVDYFFGGNGTIQTRIEGRDFSQTEQRIIQRVLAIISENLAKSWEMIYAVELEFIRSEMNPQFANIATPNEIVVVTTFRIDLGGADGEMHICMPYSMLEPIGDLLRYSMHSDTLHDNRWTALLGQKIQTAEVEIVADLCTIPFSLLNVLNMKVGDIIPITMPEIIELKADNVPIMACSYGKLNGQYALRVEKLIKDLDPFVQGVSHG